MQSNNQNKDFQNSSSLYMTDDLLNVINDNFLSQTDSEKTNNINLFSSFIKEKNALTIKTSEKDAKMYFQMSLDPNFTIKLSFFDFVFTLMLDNISIIKDEEFYFITFSVKDIQKDI